MDTKPDWKEADLSSKVLHGVGVFILILCWIGWSIIAVLFFIGLGFNLQQQFASRLFKQTDGTITMSNRHALKDEDGRYYQVDVRYTYSVDGKQYWNDRYSYFHTYAESSRNKSVVEKYPRGKQVTVYYDPSNPKESVLSRKISPWSVMPIFFFLLPTIIPPLVFVDGILKRIRWGKSRLIGGYPIIEEYSVKKVLMSTASPLMYAGFSAFAAMLLCVVFVSVYLSFCDLNLWIVGLMGVFTVASGVAGIVYAERKLFAPSSTLTIDTWNGTIRFPDRILGNSPWFDFQQVIAFEQTKSEDSAPGELLARCNQGGAEVRYQIAASRDEKSLRAVKEWLKNELGLGQ